LLKKENKKAGYNFFKYLLGPIFLIVYNPKFINKEYIPKDGPIIIAGNHKHLLDQCLPILSTKRMLHYLAKKEYFDSKMAWFFKMAGCISVNRQDKKEAHLALEEAIKLLNKGYAIGIFPEGTRNRTNQVLLPFKYGAVKMAHEANATIVPFAITGKYRIFNNNLKITFGKPFKVENMTIEEANSKLYKEINNMLK
jgi:1-acyl-sn-glycerol-3-phosphate acyltransferase